jgi:predicted nucleotidyltransferase
MQPTTRPPLPQDLKELLRLFNERGVRYLIIGAVAIGYHAQPRYTKDLHIFVSSDPANAALVHKALAEFGAPLAEVSEADLTDESKFFRFGREPVQFDVMPGVLGINFEQAWERRISGVIDEVTGLQAHIVSREDLIAAKLASGRLQDLADVDAIRRAAKATAT